MLRVASFLALAVVLSGCAAELVLEKDGALTAIPRKTDASGHLIVDTLVNGQGPFRFAVDTGASISVIYGHVATELNVEPRPGDRVTLHGMTALGTFPTAIVRSIRVGEEDWDSARVAILPDTVPVASQFDGILGLDFLGRYAVSYAHADEMLRLYPQEVVSERAYHGWSAIPLFKMRVGQGDIGVFAFEIFIGGERIPTIFDLGTDSNLMNRRAARAIGVRPPKPGTTNRVGGAFGSTIEATELIVWKLQIAERSWRRVSFLIADFPVFATLDLNRRPTAIAGTSLFKRHDFIIDFAGERLLLRDRE